MAFEGTAAFFHPASTTKACKYIPGKRDGCLPGSDDSVFYRSSELISFTHQMTLVAILLLSLAKIKRTFARFCLGTLPFFKDS
jgi:hypothetical protein